LVETAFVGELELLIIDFDTLLLSDLFAIFFIRGISLGVRAS